MSRPATCLYPMLMRLLRFERLFLCNVLAHRPARTGPTHDAFQMFAPKCLCGRSAGLPRPPGRVASHVVLRPARKDDAARKLLPRRLPSTASRSLSGRSFPETSE